MSMYKEEKYRTILEATEEELLKLKEKSLNDRWKPNYHIAPEFGLLNDPNGLAYFNDKYVLFHQWYPFGVTHGMKHWARLESDDLVNWKRKDVAIIPTELYESHGAYSGTSIEIEEKLYLYYTGNIKFDAKNRSANQCLAIMDKSGEINKYDNNPLILGVPEGYTGHVRDPKVFKKGDNYYMFLGAQRENKTGTIIVYKSLDALKWEFIGELEVEALNEKDAYMWECPDYITIDGKDVLIFSPQGIKSCGNKYNNIFTVIYIIGELDLENLKFEAHSYHELDGGFDFYAPQTFKGKEDKSLLISWAGMGEFKYPTDENGWAHCLTFPRELSVKNNKIYQKPASEINLLVESSEENEIFDNNLEIKNTVNSYKLDLNIKTLDSKKFNLSILCSDEESLDLIFNKEDKSVTLSKENLINKFAKEHGDFRTINIDNFDNFDIIVLVDNSIVEVFINNGEKSLTTRVFPLEKSTNIKLNSDNYLNVKYKKDILKNSIQN